VRPKIDLEAWRRHRSISSSAVAERSRDAWCLSVVSSKSTIRRAQSSTIGYFGFRFTAAYNWILFCSLLFVVVIHAVGCDKQDSLKRRRLCDKLHCRASQLLLACPAVIDPIARCGWESRFLPTTRAFDAPVRYGSRLNIAMTFGMEKLEWCGYQMAKKFWRYVYFIRFDRIHERDRQTDRQREWHRMTAYMAVLMHSIAR